MARHYKFHRYYGVLWYDRARQRWYYRDFITKKEAKAQFKDILNNNIEATHVELIRKISAWNYHDGRVKVEAL